MSAGIVIRNVGVRVDHEVRQGIDFLWAFAIKSAGVATNLTGFVFRGQVRKTPQAAGPAALVFSFVVNAVLGEVQMTATEAQTAALTCGDRLTDLQSLYFWDCEMVDSNGKVNGLFHGELRVHREVTRP